MKSPTRQRLIEAAIRRFYRDGFRNVGIDQILSDVEISKTAFYKHFESKEDLMLAALEMQNAWLQETFAQMIRERGGPTAMEFPLQHEPAHVAAAANKRAVEDILHALAVETGATEPRLLAQQLCLIM